MSPQAQLESLFHEARALPPGPDRVRWLESRCPDNAMRAEVWSLLEAYDRMRRATTLAPPRPPMLPETRFGPYRPVELIGRGGMSSVYRARRMDGQFEQTVALKVMASYLVGDEFLRRFHNERQVLASLAHHHITRLLDGGISSSGDPYLVTELVEGPPIDRYADEHRLRVPARLGLLLQVCEAVDYAHRNLVVHRDLKPANILVNGEGVVKLLDFGTASLLAGHSGLTRTGAGLLTPRYASPEQLRGERAGVASDIFSLGVVSFEMLTGAWPFGNPDSVLSGLNRVAGAAAARQPHTVVTEEAAQARSVSADQLRRSLKGDLSAILQKTLEHDPRRRYATVRELADDISRYLSGRPVRARGNGFAYRLRRFALRNRWRIAGGAAVSGALILAGVYSVVQYARAQRTIVQIRDLSQSYLSDILKEVRRLPGSTKASMMIVDRARRNLDELLPEAPGDPRMRSALAKAYIQLAELQGEPFAISAGDSADALASYHTAEGLASQTGTRDWETLAVLVRARLGIASIQVRAGDYQGAVATLRTTLAPARRLWQDGPPDLDIAGRSTGWVYLRCELLLGHAMLRAADVERNVAAIRQSLAQFQRTVALAEEARRKDPRLPDLAGRYSQYAGYAFEELGDFTGDSQHYRQALAAHQRSAESARAIYETAPNPQTQRDYADALYDFGWCQRVCGLHVPAVGTLTTAARLMEPVAAADQNSLESRQELAAIYARLGAAEDAAGRGADAVRHLNRAYSMVPLPARIEPTDRETVVLYVRIREELAFAMLARRQRPEAARLLREAVAAVQGGSSVPRWRVAELEGELRAAGAGRGPGTEPRPPVRAYQ